MMVSARTFALFACTLAAVPALASAQVASGGDAAVADVTSLNEDERPEVHASISPTRGVTTGDAVTLSIVAVTRAGDDVTVPSQRVGDFELLKKRMRIDDPKPDRRRFRFELTLLATAPGHSVVPPLQLRVVTKDGRLGNVSTQPLAIDVKSALGNEPNAKPKGPTSPVTVVADDYTLLWVLGTLIAIVIVVLLTLFGAKLWARRARADAPPPPPTPPWEIALARLSELRRARAEFVQEGRAVEWADAVSDALRIYLGDRFGFEGLESTSDEVVKKLGTNAPGVSAAEVASLLGDCDLVKFAKASLEDARYEELIERSIALVHATIPKLQPSTELNPRGPRGVS